MYVRLLLSERDEFFTGKMTQGAQKENRSINTKVQRKYFTPVGFTLQHFHSHHKNSKLNIFSHYCYKLERLIFLELDNCEVYFEVPTKKCNLSCHLTAVSPSVSPYECVILLRSKVDRLPEVLGLSMLQGNS